MAAAGQFTCIPLVMLYKLNRMRPTNIEMGSTKTGIVIVGNVDMMAGAALLFVGIIAAESSPSSRLCMTNGQHAKPHGASRRRYDPIALSRPDPPGAETTRL